MGCASSGHAFGLIGFSPLRGSHRGVLFGCDGSRGVLPRFNARPIDQTQVSLMLLPVIACDVDCAISHGFFRHGLPRARSVWLVPLSGTAEGT